MSVSQDELAYIQSQLEGLESIFYELLPFGVELKRHQVQEYYDKRFESATKPQANVAEVELKRQFNTKANQVRNLVDCAESFGDASNKFNLIRAAATTSDNRKQPLPEIIHSFCNKVLYQNELDPAQLAEILTLHECGVIECRMLLASVMFLVVKELNQDGGKLPVSDLLGVLLHRITQCQILSDNDPFLFEAKCTLNAMRE